MNIGMWLTIAAFVFVAFALLTNKIPGWVACAISVLVLWFAKVITQEEAFSNFVSQNIICMIAMQMLTAGILKTDILHIIASSIKKVKGGIYVMLAAVMIIPFFLCQFIGGVTAMITVIPLAMGLAKEAGLAPTLMVLPASVGAQAGLMCLPIGRASVMYLTKNQILESFGSTEALGYFDMMNCRLPASILVFIFVIFIGYKLLPQRGLADESMLENGGMKAIKRSTMPQWKQNVVYIIFVAVIILMSNAKRVGMNNIQISMIAALLMILLGVIDSNEAFRAVNWNLVFMMGFILALSTAMARSGAGEAVATLLDPIYKSGSVFVACAGTFLICVILTQVMDNTALINIFTPVVVAAAMKHGMSALPVILAVDASCLVSFSTPLASPSSLLAYQLGGYSMKEMLKFNLPCILIATVFSIFWIPFYFGAL